MKPAFFLDRDGVINIDKGYVYTEDNFEWIQDAKNAIKLIKNNGYYVFVITNQSGISRGYYTEDHVNALHEFIQKKLNDNNTEVDEFFYSPYHPDSDTKLYDHLKDLRKPNTGMLNLAFKKWKIIKEESHLIGDKETDISCGIKFGIKSHLFKGGSLLKFVEDILN